MKTRRGKSVSSSQQASKKACSSKSSPKKQMKEKEEEDEDKSQFSVPENAPAKEGGMPSEPVVEHDSGAIPQNRDSIIMSHWLFADEGSGFKPPKMGFRGIPPPTTASVPASSLFTLAKHVQEGVADNVSSRESSQELSTTVSARDTSRSTKNEKSNIQSPRFSSASGKPSVTVPVEEQQIKVPLDLGNALPTDANEGEKTSGQVTKRECSARLLERTYSTTDKVVDYVDTTGPQPVTVLESWCRNCVLTNHDGSSLSHSMLSRLWNIYGNPFKVTYSNSEKFTFIKYSPCEDSITVGGINEIYQCFQQIMQKCVNKSQELERFSFTWMRNKFCLYATAECRRFRRRVYRLIHRGKELKDAILRVQLPNPLTVIKRILWVFNQEYDGKDSILMRILHGDAPANSPVVVRVECINGDDVCITDGQSVLRSIAADCYVKQLIKNRRICVGRKLQLHGIAIDVDASRNEESAVVKLNYNAISPALKRPVGLQNTHSNGHIRELKGGAGKVSQLDVTVIGVMPQIFKVFYRTPETNRTMWALLGDWEFASQFGDPMVKPPVEVENIHILQSITVIDTIMLLRIKDYLRDPQSFQKALIKSCAVLTLRNLDDTIMSMIKPGSRIKISNLNVHYSSPFNAGYIQAHRNHQYIGNYLNFYSTNQSRIDIKDRDTPLQNIRRTVLEYKTGMKGGVNDSDGGDMALGENKSIFRTLILGEPALSISSHNEAEFFELLRRDHEYPGEHAGEMFLNQYCSVTGVLLDVGDIVTSGSGWSFFRCFILTTCFKIVSIRVSATNPYQNKADGPVQRRHPAILEHITARLLAHRLTIAKGPEIESRKPRSVFMCYMNIQYAGHDEAYGVYNFFTTANKFAMRESNILHNLQGYMQKTLLFSYGPGHAINYDSVRSLGDTEIERDCRAFAKTLARAKVKACHLLNAKSEDMQLCEEFTSNSHF